MITLIRTLLVAAMVSTTSLSQLRATETTSKAAKPAVKAKATDKVDVTWQNDPTCQFVFFAVLEGLYTDGVQDEIVELILRHVGRHISSSHGPEGAEDVSRLVNGLNIGRRYDTEDRLIALSTAACAVSGPAAKRQDVMPLPDPVSWEQIDRWVRVFSRDSQSGRIERCLFTARTLGHEDRVLPLLM